MPEVGELQWQAMRREWRRWSGKDWVPALYSRDAAALKREDAFEQPRVESARRQKLLMQAVSAETLRGGTPVLQDNFATVMAYKRPVQHWFYLLLTLLTAGLGGILWIIAVLTRAEDRVRMDVDDWGNVWASEVSR